MSRWGCWNKKTAAEIARIRELAAAGRSRDSIAQEMGVSFTTVKKYAAGFSFDHRHAPRPRRKRAGKERLCLKCDRPFKSRGKYNRLCPRCHASNEDAARAVNEFLPYDEGGEI
jgi:hypothetical protein